MARQQKNYSDDGQSLPYSSWRDGDDCKPVIVDSVRTAGVRYLRASHTPCFSLGIAIPGRCSRHTSHSASMQPRILSCGIFLIHHVCKKYVAKVYCIFVDSVLTPGHISVFNISPALMQQMLSENSLLNHLS